MRTLAEILESAKDGQRPTDDESYYSMLVLCGLMNLTMSDVRKMARETTSLWFRKLQSEETQRRYRKALNTDPRQYLGNDVPENPGYQRERAVFKRLFDRAVERAQQEPDHA